MSQESQQTATYAAQASVTDINQRLYDRCNHKRFKIHSLTPCETADGGEIHVPHLRPHLVVRWGDGSQDHIETDDAEVLCIVASNPYSNVTLRNFTVVFAAVNPKDGKPLPCLPDGTPSVSITPSEMIGFGDLPPRAPNQPEGTGHSEAREVLLISRGARRGDYLLKLHYSYSVEVTLAADDQFPLTLVRS